MPELINRDEGRGLFGANPQGYNSSRPGYPDWIFAQLSDDGLLRAGAATLEIGAGTGIATQRLIAFGADDLTLIEPDQRFAPLLETLRQSTGSALQLIYEPFESVQLPAQSFDLIVSATAFHWIAPEQGWLKLHQLLRRPNSAAALFWNVLQQPGRQDPFHEATTDLLAPLADSPSGKPDKLPYALDRIARTADARAAGFTSIDYQESRWTATLSTTQIGQLYEGFSQIQRLPPEPRTRLLARLMEVADSSFAGQVERYVTTCLYVLR